ncbi:MAG: carboxypeptidase regulatory-like domain-containing protein [Acidobacteria bacterium]|nr:carboxypeptidase regulatory-like domain-containing protein [Acidobacteriota bacterium]
MKKRILALSLFSMALITVSYLAANAVKANGYYLEIAAGAPLLQNWTDTTLLNGPDDWTQIVAIEAFTGANLAPMRGSDARTILADNASGTMRVVPNQTDPVSSTADAVAEFEIANPTIALKGSDSSSAPNLVIHVNTTQGCAGKAVTVRYDVRDIDASPVDAVSQVNTQYRIGGTGPYINVPFGYLADGTTGVGQATAVNSRYITLPLAATGQPMVDIRIMTVNSAGADEWVGIDNIGVDCVMVSAGTAVVTGQVRDSQGRGIAKARITVTDPNSGVTYTAISGAFGYYHFDGLEVGSTYIISVGHKGYTFRNTTQSLMLLQDTDGVDFETN